MIKDFFHLQSCRHLLYKTIDLSQFFLLPLKIFFASFPVELNKGKHEQKKDHNDQRQTDAQDHHHDYGSEEHHKALYDHGKAVVHSLLYRIHIIGKPAHQLSMSMSVEIF